jgi:hypothetical protein
VSFGKQLQRKSSPAVGVKFMNDAMDHCNKHGFGWQLDLDLADGKDRSDSEHLEYHLLDRSDSPFRIDDQKDTFWANQR